MTDLSLGPSQSPFPGTIIPLFECGGTSYMLSFYLYCIVCWDKNEHTQNSGKNEHFEL